MMNGKRLFLTLGLMTGLMGLFPACGNDADTVLRVIVDGTVVQGRRIARLDVDVEIQGQTKTFNVPRRPEILALPRDFTIQISPDLKGPIRVDVTALGTDRMPVGQGMAVLPNVRSGQLNTIMVTLSPVVVPEADAGVDPEDGGVEPDALPPGDPDGGVQPDAGVVVDADPDVDGPQDPPDADSPDTAGDADGNEADAF